jgi:hypothetical protein
MRRLASRYGLAVLFFAGLVHAEQTEIDAARETAKAAFAAYQEGRYQEAADKFGEAYRVVRVPTLGRDRARALAMLALWVEAAELYREVTELEVGVGDLKMQEEAKADAGRERSELLPQIPKLMLQIQGADPGLIDIAIDGVSVPSAQATTPRLVNPGLHKIVARRGSQEVVQNAKLAPGEIRIVRLVFSAVEQPLLSPAAPPPPTTLAAPSSPSADRGSSSSLRRTLAWAAVGIGGAGIVFGGVTRAIAWQKKSDLDQNGCNESHQCFDDQVGAVDSYNSLRVLSTVGLVAGAVTAAGGATLILTAPKSESTALPRVVPWVGVARAGLIGHF